MINQKYAWIEKNSLKVPLSKTFESCKTDYLWWAVAKSKTDLCLVSGEENYCRAHIMKLELKFETNFLLWFYNHC